MIPSYFVGRTALHVTKQIIFHQTIMTKLMELHAVCKKTNHSEKDFFHKKTNKGNGEDKISFLTASRNANGLWIQEQKYINKTLFKSLKQVYTQIA